MNIEELQRWFHNHVTLYGRPYELDDEQAAVILDGHKNSLVTARAGAGKTHTLVAKIVYLICQKGVDPSKILALGFNKKPQEDFQKRLDSILIDSHPLYAEGNIARTFHSLAYSFAYEGGDIIDAEGNYQNRYIEQIVKKTIDPQFIYDYIRDDSHEPKREDYDSDADYYAAVRCNRFETLRGDIVKSRGEKIIADYLFEHGIDYGYENHNLFPDKLAKYAKDDESREKLLTAKTKIVPDFCIKHNNTILLWEHWGIRGNETPAEIKEINKCGAIGNYYDYKANKEFKEWFYSGEWLDDSLIDTDAASEDKYLQIFLQCQREIVATNFCRGTLREDFEKEIASLLLNFGITNEKMSEDELLKRFAQMGVANIDNTNNRVNQFIQRAEQQFPGNFYDLKKACEKTTESQVQKFYKVSLAVYDIYSKELSSDPSKGKREILDNLFPDKVFTCDYAMLMDRAAKNILKGYSAKNIDLDNLEYVFLDEYQDFSLLFLNLIQALCKRNSKIKIVAVGDDWQAINSFAGASLEYFKNFEKYFTEDVRKYKIATNRRSVKSIVKKANEFMLKSLNDPDGSVSIKDDINLDSLNNCILTEIRDFRDDDFKITEQNNQKKYFLLLAEIIKNNAGKKFKILNRTNNIKFDQYDSDRLDSFARKFKTSYVDKIDGVDFDKDIDFMTVNQSKGLEADIVIILESDMGRFPIFHPDNYLYEVFGDTEQAALDEQKRLFYVALTRAKEKIYVVHKFEHKDTQEERNGDFLNYLNINDMPVYKEDSFASMQDQLISGKINNFKAVAFKFIPNKKKPENTDILIATSNHDAVRQFSAFPNSASLSQMRELAQKCSRDNPMRVYASRSTARNGMVFLHMFSRPSRHMNEYTSRLY